MSHRGILHIKSEAIGDHCFKRSVPKKICFSSKVLVAPEPKDHSIDQATIKSLWLSKDCYKNAQYELELELMALVNKYSRIDSLKDAMEVYLLTIEFS